MGPGMFVSIGPPAFTGLAYIGVAKAAIDAFPHTFVVGTEQSPYRPSSQSHCDFSRNLIVDTVPFLLLPLHGRTSFHLTWCACVFPNTGFIIAMIQIREVIRS